MFGLLSWKLNQCVCCVCVGGGGAAGGGLGGGEGGVQEKFSEIVTPRHLAKGTDSKTVP